MPASAAKPIQFTPEEQRRERRPRVLLTGRLVFGEADLTVDCVIRDLTETGARLKLSGQAVLPAKLKLIEVNGGRVHDCEVSWRRLPEIGVSFLSSQDLETGQSGESAELKRLRRMWQDAKAR